MISRIPKEINFKFILPLSMLFLMIYLAADAVAYKMVAIGPALEPGPPFIFPLSYALADVIAEVYGYKIVKKVIWVTLFYQFLFAVIVSLIIRLPSPVFWHLQHSYDDVFNNIVRFILAGTIGNLSSNFINVYAMSKLKIFMRGKYFWLRSIGASAIGGFVLTTIMLIVGYSKTLDIKQALVMFISIYFLELAYAILLAWPAWLLAGFLKIKEQIDVYDINTNFNPFSFK